jgi:hypothetical protein
MVTLQLDGESAVDIEALETHPRWSELLRELVRGLRHGLNGALSAAEATIHLAVDDGDLDEAPAAEIRQSFALLERLIGALEPLTPHALGQEPEPIALDQVIASLRTTLDLQLDTLGTTFAVDASTLPPVRAPWGALGDALLLLLTRASRGAKAAGVRQVDLDGRTDSGFLSLRASFRDAAGAAVEVGTLRAPLL